MSPVRAIPTSRAYWELRAEQVLNRVFAPEAPIDVEVRHSADAAAPDSAETPPPAQRSASAPRSAAMPITDTWLLVGISLLVTLATGFSLLGLTLWQQSQQAVRQERSMLLVERLRALGPAVAPPAPELGSGSRPTPDPQAPPAAGQSAGGLPPPALEPWMEELASLPASSAPPSRVLQVPMSRRVTSPPPAAKPPPTSAAPAPAPAPTNLPQLVGVVQVPGQPASAIFQVNGSSTSAASGESIGNSGWTLQSASGDSALIERQGVQQRISISSGL